MTVRPWRHLARRFSAPGIFSIILLASGLLGSGPVFAQQGGEVPVQDRPASFTLDAFAPTNPYALPSVLRQRLPAQVRRRLEGRQPGSEAAPFAAVPGISSSAGAAPSSHLSGTGPVQSWVLDGHPNPALNFDYSRGARAAGDVNGDGVNDYLYSTSTARDERTAVLEDETGKTALFFGGTPGQSVDQLMYAVLHPAGDLNGDGFDDAVELDPSTETATIYAGSPSGYVDSGVSVSLSPAAWLGDGAEIRGFADLDGDGSEDALIGEVDAAENAVVLFGAADLASVSAQVYTLSSSGYFSSRTYNVADLDGNGSAEIVRLSGDGWEPEGMSLQVFAVDGNRAPALIQDFPAPELTDGAADRHELSLVDASGDDRLEVVVRHIRGLSTYVYPLTETGLLREVPYVLAVDYRAADNAVPVGDLDGDGNHDFYVYDSASDTRYVAFGPDDLADGFRFDTEIPYATDESGSVEFDVAGGFGDVTGDGIPDVLLRYVDRDDYFWGRRFFSVNADRSARVITDVTYPSATFSDRVTATQDLDFNGDEIADLARARSAPGRVEIFYGGASLSQTPDLTIEERSTSIIVGLQGGDLNGDGYDDLVAGVDVGDRILVFFGGPGADAVADHTIMMGSERLYNPRVIGDVNDDGIDDLMATNLGFDSDVAVVSLFYGGSSLPSTADVTIPFANEFDAGLSGGALGDVNGDGIDDFAIGRMDAWRNATSRGVVEIRFGAATPSFDDAPDLVLQSESDAYTLWFGAGVAAGDFNGDGVRDVAVKPYYVSSASGTANLIVSVFFGGPAMDAVPDLHLRVPTPAFGPSALEGDLEGDGFLNVLDGVLRRVPDVDGDGADELFLGSGRLFTNAVLFRPNVSRAPVQVFEAPNQDAGLGGNYLLGGEIAVADFNDDGAVDLVLTQENDRNEAHWSSRVYRYVVDPTAFAPAVPENVQVARGDDGRSATLTWDAVSSPDLAGYNVYRSDAPFVDTDDATHVNASRLTGATFTESNLPEGTTLYYRISAVDVSGNESSLTPHRSVTTTGLAASSTLFVDGEGEHYFGETGTTIRFTGVSASGDVTVHRYVGAPADPDGIPDANVSDYRIVIEAGSGLQFTAAEVRFAVRTFRGMTDPATVTIYKRDGEGAGTFTSLFTEVETQGTSDVIDDVLFATTDAFSEFAFGSDTSPLPVDLAGFEGRVDGDAARLTWATAAESGNAGFAVERRVGEGAWTALGFVPGAGTTTEPRSYRFVDDALPYAADRLTYRLKQVDTDGSPHYSAEIQLQRVLGAVELLGTYPNPARQSATIRYVVPQRQAVAIDLYDLMGRKVRTVVEQEQQGRQTARLDVSGLASGVYFLRLQSGAEVRTQKLTVVR